MANGTYRPPPGPQAPQRYGSVGPNYRQYGEQTQNGFYYDPGTDSYKIDPTARKKQLQDQGVLPKDPSLIEQVAPLAAGAAAVGIGSGLAKNPGEFLGGIGKGLKDFGGHFGLGTQSADQGANILTTGMPEVINSAIPEVSGIGPILDGSQYAANIESATPGTFSLSGIGSAGNAFLPAIGAVGAFDLFSNDRGPIGGGIEGAASGAAIGSFFGAPGAGIGAAIGGGIGLIKGLFEHETTTEAEQKRWGNLQKSGVANANVAYAANHPEGDTGVWQTGPFAGKKWNFEDASTLAKQDPSHFRLVYGNLKTFGNDWSNYSPGQQDSIVKALLENNLYTPKKGDVMIKDETQARQIANDVLSGKYAQSQAQQPGAQVVKQTAPPEVQKITANNVFQGLRSIE